MATRVFDGIKFCEQILKRTSQGTFLPTLVQIGPRGLGEEIDDDARRTTHDGRRTPGDPKSTLCSGELKKPSTLKTNSFVLAILHMSSGKCTLSLWTSL